MGHTCRHARPALPCSTRAGGQRAASEGLPAQPSGLAHPSTASRSLLLRQCKPRGTAALQAPAGTWGPSQNSALAAAASGPACCACTRVARTPTDAPIACCLVPICAAASRLTWGREARARQWQQAAGGRSVGGRRWLSAQAAAQAHRLHISHRCFASRLALPNSAQWLPLEENSLPKTSGPCAALRGRKGTVS